MEYTPKFLSNTACCFKFDNNNITWFDNMQALFTASASTSSGRDNSCPLGPLTPEFNNRFVFLI